MTGVLIVCIFRLPPKRAQIAPTQAIDVDCTAMLNYSLGKSSVQFRRELTDSGRAILQPSLPEAFRTSPWVPEAWALTSICGVEHPVP